MTETIHPVIDAFRHAGQGQVFNFFNRLSAVDQTRLLDEAAEVDLAEVDRWVQALVTPSDRGACDLRGLLPAPYKKHPSNGGDAAAWLEARAAGEAALRAGRVAAFTVAGGQGTRLGYDGPKGTFQVTPVRHKSLFQVFAEKLLAAQRNYGAPLHWFIMTSHQNHEATEAFFTENRSFGLDPGRIHLIRQGRMPAVDFTGKILLESPGSLALSPDGHGGSLRAMDRSGALDLMASEKVDTISYFQVDNPLVRCIDPAFIGWHLNARSEMSSKMVPKGYADEKLGHFCVQEGILKVIEYSDLPAALQHETDDGGSLRYLAGNIAVHILDRDFVRKVSRGELPFHRADKKIRTVDSQGREFDPEKPNGVKFEMFVFDALPFAKNPLVIETQRSDDFSPVKNATGVDSPETCRRHQLEQFARWLASAGVSVPRSTEGVPTLNMEVSPMFATDDQGFAASWTKLAPKPMVRDGLYLDSPPPMTIADAILSAEKSGQLLPSSVENINAFLSAGLPQWARDSIAELVEKQAWSELNDRFYRQLEFGTGGIRGRTIAAVPAAAETGKLSAKGSPEHAAVGSNLLNDFTLVRAVVGLFRYTRRYLQSKGDQARPRFVIAHDVRHFSRHFCELAASAWTQLGGEAFIFDGPRPTPQLSYSVRWLKAHAGAVITASHNPPHDNGFKAYFGDGGQVVAPHDSGIVAEVAAVPLGELSVYFSKDLSGVVTLRRDADDAYLATAASAAIDPSVLRGSGLKVVFTNIHGTGAIHSLPLLVHAGCNVFEVRSQLDFDARFPTVKSPNPENAEALSLAVALAEKEQAEVVVATDPDCDRMGVAVRSRAGRMELLSGNQIGALLAEYRLIKYKEIGVIPQAGSMNACVIKTFVTSRLQDEICARHGVKVVNTLTGFKWIAAKIGYYEAKLRERMEPEFDYDQTPFAERAALLLKHSTFFAFGCEESYGYLPNDGVRDKDGNAACLMFAELCAWVKSRGLTVPEYLDELYLKYGFYLEGTINLYYEGATGNAKIKRILDTYRSAPPTVFGGVQVSNFQDFGREKILDEDGIEIPQQDLYVVTLANGYRFAARGSGTEPKMKFYLFASEPASDKAELDLVKSRVKSELERLGHRIEADARQRAEG